MILSNELKLEGMPIIYVVISLVGLVYLFFLVRDDRNKLLSFIKEKYLPIRLLTILGAWNLGRTVYLAITNIGGDVEVLGLPISIFALSIVGLSMVVNGADYSKAYLLVILVTGALTVTFAFCFELFKFEWISELIILTNMVASILYLEEKRKFLQYVFLICMALADVLLVMKGEYLGIAFLGAFYILIPIVSINTKGNIKRTGLMLLMLMLITSNMCLVQFFFEELSGETALTLEGSIYLDVLIAIAGMFFFNYWEKLPENVDEDKLILRRFRTGLVSFFIAYVFVLVSVIIGKETILSFTDEGAKGGIKMLFSPLLMSLNGENMLAHLIEKIDLFSIVLILFIFIRFVMSGNERTKQSTFVLRDMFLVSSSFLVVTVFWKLNYGAIVAAYLLLLVVAFTNESPREIKKIPVNIDNIKRLLGDISGNIDEE